MASDVTLNAGAGGAIIRTDPTTSSEHFQMIKVAYGDTGTFNFVSTALPFPVINSSAFAVNVTSGIITLSSAIGISSGIVTLSSPTSLSSGIVTLSSAGLTQIIPVTSSGVNLYTTAGINVVSASSGLIQVLTTGVYLVTGTMSISSGTITLSSAIGVSSGIITLSSAGITQVIPVTSSGVNLYTTSGINVVSASSGLVQISGNVTVLYSSTPVIQSASSGSVQLVGVTSSGQSMALIYTTGGSTATNLTTAASNLKSFMFYNSSVAAFAVKIYNTTAPTIGSTAGQVLVVVAPGSTGGGGANMAFEYPGPYSSNGWTLVPTLSINATSTDAPSSGHPLNVTYQV